MERVTIEVYEQLNRYCQATILSALEATFDSSIRVAASGSHRDMLLATLNPLTYFRIFRHLRQTQTTVLYINSAHMANVPVIMLCRLFTRIFVISHIHDPACAASWLVAKVANSVVRAQSLLSHRVYCWGYAIKNAISKLFCIPPDAIVVFHHGPGHPTSCDLSDAHLPAGPFQSFTFVGGFLERKGISVLLEAARLFNQRYGSEKATFLMAGSGDLSRYSHAIDELPNLTVWNRFIPDGEINEILQRSKALVLPYIAGMMQTSFVAIAYGNGCPVIVSRNGSMAEEIEEGITGYVVDPGDASQLADVMGTMCEAGVRERLSSNCLHYYRTNFSWAQIGAEMCQDMRNASQSRFVTERQAT